MIIVFQIKALLLDQPLLHTLRCAHWTHSSTQSLAELQIDFRNCHFQVHCCTFIWNGESWENFFAWLLLLHSPVGPCKVIGCDVYLSSIGEHLYYLVWLGKCILIRTQKERFYILYSNFRKYVSVFKLYSKFLEYISISKQITDNYYFNYTVQDSLWVQDY